MKYKVFFLSVLFASLAIPNSAKAYDFSYTYQGKTLFYNIVNGEAQVTFQRSLAPTYNNPHLSGTVEIPNVVTYNGNTYTVTSIGNRAFESCSSITSVIIGDSVTSIGTSAFQSCTGLTSVTIGNHVTSIESQAFGYCTGLTSVTIGNSVISIGGSAFNACSSLTSVSLGNSVASIGSYAFSQCTSLDSIVIPNSVTHIGQYAFNQCSGLTYLDLGNGVSYLGFCAFRDCDSLTSITIPSSVDTLYGSVFSSCNNLTTVYYNATNCYEYTNYGSYRSFAYCSSLDTVFVGNSVQTMPSDLFYNTSISTVIIGDSVSTISAGAFDGCRKLTSVFIPNSVTRIEQSAFNGCDSLCSITIPNSVNFIGTAAFVGNSLRTIIIGNGVDTIEQSAFGHSDYYYITDTVYIYMMSETVPTFVSHLSPFHFLRCAFVLQGCTAFENYRTYNNYVDGTYTYNFAAQTLLYPADDLILNVSSNNTDRGTAQIVQLYGHNVRCDSTAVISATANSGYHFDHWSTGSTSNPDTLHLTSNTSITAYFVSNNAIQYTLTVNSADPTMGSVSGGGTYSEDAAATLTATANSGYHFTHWQDGNTQNPRTIIVSSNATYTAYFEADDFGTTCVITQFPYTMNFDNDTIATCWETYDGDGDGMSWFLNGNHGVGGTGCMAVIYNNSGANDDYLYSPWILTPGSYTISWKACAMSSNYPETYSVYYMSDSLLFSETISSTSYMTRSAQFTVNAGDSAYITFHYTSNDMYYLFIDDIVITQNITAYTLTVNSANPSMGSVSGGGTYNSGATATLTATANSGYHFTQWQDGNTSNPRTVTVTGDATYTAYFEADAPTQYTLTVTTANPSMGSVSGGGTYNANATATLTATANDGYHFTHWQDNNTQNPRIVTVTANATYTAYFEQDATDPCTITTLPYTESFEGSMDCWTIVDANNDNNTWVVSNSFGEGSGVVNPHSGSKMAASFSWNTNPFNANEYLISPAIVLPSSNISLSWWYRVNGEYPADKLAVKVSTTTNATSSFTNTLIDITPTAANNNWTLQTVDLSAFAGQTIYIAFHHHDTYDNNYICIDDITISQGTTPTQYTITVNSANSSMGSVSGGGTYNSGSTATLTAIANSGYRFDHWQDNNTQNPRTITVTGNATYTAYFVATQGIGDVIADAVNVYTLGGQIVVETDLKDEISIYDIVGRKVDGGRKTRFDVPASGVYLVKIGTMPTQKVVLVK